MNDGRDGNRQVSAAIFAREHPAGAARSVAAKLTSSGEQQPDCEDPGERR
jgi:hypothetical protein